ncbi:unnamed protein product [Bursaphelenchus okinawaensis]|uniref:Aspartate aminotransferase, mitochondrial n=1 Tax=Bursaphelenchus okinawaensis TaxID=465554 RepID=A0A811LDV0_9BILA|nr:unnamed protein product [Bursaphelenchus okinawaensis]CAG9121255.1 unnamed protein product [Bursaphelenchus okinawaensis]
MSFFAICAESQPSSSDANGVNDNTIDLRTETFPYYSEHFHDLRQYITDVRKQLYLNPKPHREYLPNLGSQEFSDAARSLCFGPENPILQDEHRLLGIQTIGGYGAIVVATHFIKNNLKLSRVYVPLPTWEEHIGILERNGLEVCAMTWRTRDEAERGECRLIKEAKLMPKHSAVLLQASCHNPTGQNLTKAEWQQLLDIFEENEVLPLFDLAYQGLGRSLSDDAWPIREFAKRGKEFLVAQSFSANFYLFDESLGHVIAGMAPNHPDSQKTFQNLHSAFSRIVQVKWANPAFFGCRLVTEVLTNPSLLESWKNALKSVRMKLQKERNKMITGLEADEIASKSEGIYVVLNLNESQILKLQTDFNILMDPNGSINMTCLNNKNRTRFYNAVNAVTVTDTKDKGKQHEDDVPLILSYI